MRRARIVEEAGGYYHVMSRIVDRRMVIDDSEKGTLRYLMRGMEGFSGVEIVTYAILDNHYPRGEVGGRDSPLPSGERSP